MLRQFEQLTSIYLGNVLAKIVTNIPIAHSLDPHYLLGDEGFQKLKSLGDENFL